MSATHYDYTKLRAEFIRTRPKISIRELGRRNGIPENRINSIHKAAKKADSQGRTWYDLQEAFDAKTEDAFINEASKMEAARRVRLSQVKDNALEFLDEAITAARLRVAAREVLYDAEGKQTGITAPNAPSVRELTLFVDRLDTVFASNPSEGGLPSGSGDADPGGGFLIAGGSGDVGRQLAAVLGVGAGGRPGQPVGRTVVGRALPALEAPSQDG